MQNAFSHVFYSDISKDKPHLINDVRPYIMCSIVNAHSINKMDGFEFYVYALKPNLVMITESWVREDISDAELSVNDCYIL